MGAPGRIVNVKLEKAPSLARAGCLSGNDASPLRPLLAFRAPAEPAQSILWGVSEGPRGP